MKYPIGILSFLYKLYIGILFSVLLVIFYFPIVLLKRSKKWKKHSFKVFVLWSWIMRILALIVVRFDRKIELPKAPYVIISNHSSYLDIFLMFSLYPQNPFLFLGKSEILSYPLVKSFFKNLNIPVYRNDRLKAAKSFIQAKNALNDGWSLVVFPEGGIPDDNLPKMKDFKEGAFKLAKAARVPIVPLTFLNNYKLFSDPDKFLGQARPGICHIVQHDVISAEEVEQKSVEEMMDFCFKLIEKPLL